MSCLPMRVPGFFSRLLVVMKTRHLNLIGKGNGYFTFPSFLSFLPYFPSEWTKKYVLCLWRFVATPPMLNAYERICQILLFLIWRKCMASHLRHMIDCSSSWTVLIPVNFFFFLYNKLSQCR